MSHVRRHRVSPKALGLALALAMVAFASAVVVAATAGAKASTTRSCGHVRVDFRPEGSGGGMKIRARGVSCPSAKKLVRTCVAGKVPRGWTVVNDKRTLMTKGARRVAYTAVGGGGCGSFQQSCSDFGYRGVGFFNMHALGPRCSGARTLARTWYDAGGSCRFGSACTVKRYRCRGNPRTATVTCRRAENGFRVDWQMGE